MAKPSLINTNFPVFLPEMSELRFPKAEFRETVESFALGRKGEPFYGKATIPIRGHAAPAEDGKPSEKPATAKDAKLAADQGKTKQAPFMEALYRDKAAMPSLDSRDGKMLTENADVAHHTSQAPLVDLFYEVEDVISADRLKEVLETAWADDALATLKIIWNARSIHLGKSSRQTFYRALGWLAENHPLTLIMNLPWLVRPLIQKKVPKADAKEEEGAAVVIHAKDVDSDFEMIDEDDGRAEGEPQRKKIKLEDDPELAEFDIKYGVAHGYWKDLVNILALAANDELKFDGQPRSVLNVSAPSKSKKYNRDWTEGRKKVVNSERHDRVVKKLAENGFYRALHLSVARLFADQLKLDLARLRSDNKVDKKCITLAAKWAPSHKGMHDQHTCIVSTIAEMLYPFESVCPEGVDPADRDLYLKHARIAYQSQTLAPLRKHIDIVERHITTQTFGEIKYERIPSLAMQQYTPLFASKDYERFDQYLEKVASGKAQISGATLFPSTLVQAVIDAGNVFSMQDKSAKAMVEKKVREIHLRSINGQWNTLVQRIKDSGTLNDSIAICDVSGSMEGPVFHDGSNPMCSSIGLALLIAEVTKPPFGGAFITFHSYPSLLRVGGADDTRSFKEKVEYIKRSPWGGSTNFVSVFENLILPLAIKNELKQEDMVKQIFVFSDMQFNSADDHREKWTTSYERIQKQFNEAGYEVPKLIFWNLAGGRAGHTGVGDETAPKPVTAAEENTALVSGYSQGQVKIFLESGGFEGPEEEEEVVVKEEMVDEDGEVVVVEKKMKTKMNPLTVVKKAIGHEAYRMLRVLD